MEQSYHPDCVEDNDFAVGKIGGCGVAATASNEKNYVDGILGRFHNQQVYENPDVLLNKYF